MRNRLISLAVVCVAWTGVVCAETDVVVYGATPAGIAAALAAASNGEHVVLIEPTARIGGLVTCGLSHTDFRTFEGFTGFYREFTRRVEVYYREAYGPDAPQVRESFRGSQAEPKVNLLIFECMRSETGVIMRRGWRVESAEKNGPRIHRITVCSGTGGFQSHISARIFIDASYEGDLMAAAGVKYRVGREGRAEYGESLAPEKPDDQLQGYNFRLIMTRDPSNRVTPTAPPGYKREDFVGVLPLLEAGKIKRTFGYPSGCLYKAQIPSLPNGKFDINDVSRGLVRLSLPGENAQWPTGAATTRQRIFNEHLRWDVGLLYFLQNDEAVPAKFRDEARGWGWCKDEFVETGHLPPQLYIREARRMVGQYVFTEKDTDHAPGDARGVLRRDAIAMGDYGPNCHGTAHEGSRFGGQHTGEFYKPVPPYQIPYGVLVPREVDNLLVPVACSASHVGFCALRLEPIWASLGQAAGHAAHLALAEGVPVQQVPVEKLQARLHAVGAATVYVSDVLPGHPDFAAVQWWGTHGGLHELAPMPATPGQRGKNIIGQYHEAYPDHAAELDKPLDAELAKRWLALAKELGVAPEKLPAADSKLTRGDFIRRVFALKGRAR